MDSSLAGVLPYQQRPADLVWAAPLHTYCATPALQPPPQCSPRHCSPPYCTNTPHRCPSPYYYSPPHCDFSRCPNAQYVAHTNPWLRAHRRCPRSYRKMTPRVEAALPPPVEGPSGLPITLQASKAPAHTPHSPHTPALHLYLTHPSSPQVVSTAPRVRLLHNFVSAEEAEELISIAQSHFHRSSTVCTCVCTSVCVCACVRACRRH